MLTDLRVAQFLCSRLCHDLVSVAGAVNAGLELIGEGVGGPERQEAMALVEKSARQVTRRLAFYRLAFGAGGGARALADALAAARDLFADGDVRLSLPGDVRALPPLAADGARLLLALVLVAAGTLPRGGALAVHLAPLPEGTGLAVTAEGQGANLRDDIRAALAGEIPADALTARNVHAHFARCLAQAMGGTVECAVESGVVRLAAAVPKS